MNPDLLSQLRDIHTVAPAPWWPPAPGWWVLAVLVLLLLVWLGRRMLARLRMHKRRKQMLGWVDHLNANIDPRRNPQAYLSTLNRIFKLVALRAFPDQPCAALNGQEWVDFLIEKMHGSPAAESLKVLASGPYDPSPKFDHELLSGLTRRWIRQYG
jgi:hypothetical protein